MQKNGERVGIFLDRDGVINYERPDYVKSVQEFEFLEGSIEGIKTLNRLRFPIIIVTNQSAVGRGILSETRLAQIHSYMLERVKEAGARIDAILYCPHKPDENCECRKPSTGMLKKAANLFGISLESSWLIGDKHTDEEAGSFVGCKTIKIPSNTSGALLEAARRLLNYYGLS